jgi:hypothetical protein
VICFGFSYVMTGCDFVVLMVGTVKTLGNLQSPSNDNIPFNHKQVPY